VTHMKKDVRFPVVQRESVRRSKTVIDVNETSGGDTTCTHQGSETVKINR
jgi:hypothetical protein